VELPDAVQLVIVRREPVRAAFWLPAGSCLRADRERPELVEREDTLRDVLHDVLDPREFRLPLRVVRFLPCLCPLEGDLVFAQQLPQSFAAHEHGPVGVAGQIRGEFADAPPGERLPEFGRARAGRRDDEPLVVRTDLAGTATRPLRVQAGHAHLVESVDHLPDGVFIGLDQTGDHRHRVSAGRGEHDHGAAQPDRRAGPTTHESLQLLAFLIT
jgi:hypothetical protein